MLKFQENYIKTIAPALKDKFAIKNSMAVPRVLKIVVNVGVGKLAKDNKYIDQVASDIAKITGQTPVRTLARKSIAGFKVREGQTVGVTATLRGEKMYGFLDRLINVALPRVKDFRGVKASGADKSGNFSLGLREHAVFPEIPPDHLDNTFGLQITIVTTAKNNESLYELLKLMKFPFSQSEE